MEIEDIITLEQDIEYLILDKVELDNNNYLYAVLIDSEENPLDEYVYLKEINENNEMYVEEVVNEEIKDKLSKMFTLNYLEEINEEQDD